MPLFGCSFYELGHHARRRHTLHRKHRKIWLHPTPENFEEERKAEEYAKKRFLEWKMISGCR